MPAAPLLALAVALAATPHDPLAELRSALGALQASGDLRARVVHRIERTRGEKDDALRWEGEVEAELADGRRGLQVAWGRDVLGRLRDEASRRARDPEATSPTRDALAELDPGELEAHLDAARWLLAELERARLIEERDDELDGAPARLLRLELDPGLSGRDRRYVKNASALARVWLDADGLPLAADVEVRYAGRLMLVVTFEGERRERLRFARAGDRLVTVRREREQRSSGAGENGRSRSVTTLELLP